MLQVSGFRFLIAGCMCELSRVNVHYLLLLFFLLETPWNSLKLLETPSSLLYSVLYFQMTSDYVPLLSSSLADSTSNANANVNVNVNVNANANANANAIDRVRVRVRFFEESGDDHWSFLLYLLLISIELSKTCRVHPPLSNRINFVKVKLFWSH